MKGNKPILFTEDNYIQYKAKFIMTYRQGDFVLDSLAVPQAQLGAACVGYMYMYEF